MVRFENAFDCPAAFTNISLQTSCQTDVVIRVHKNFEIEHFIYLLVKKTKDALKDD